MTVLAVGGVVLLLGFFIFLYMMIEDKKKDIVKIFIAAFVTGILALFFLVFMAELKGGWEKQEGKYLQSREL